MYTNVKLAFIILVLSSFFVSKINGNFPSLHSILLQTIQKTKPFQITFFTSDFFAKNNVKIVREFNEFPSLRLVPQNLNNDMTSWVSNSTVLKKTLQMSLNVIYADDVNFVIQVIDYISQVVPIYGRSKCLCMLLTKFKNFDQSDIEKIQMYAWKNKILDFTVIQKNYQQDDASMMYYFDPFNFLFHVQPLINNQTCIFPDRFRNVNKYPMKVGRGEEFLSGSNDIVKQKFSIFYSLRTMNFDLVLVNANDAGYYHYENNSLWFTIMHTNVLGGPVISRELKDIISIVSTDLDCRKILAVLPILFVPKVFVPVKILFHIVFIPGTIIFFIFLTQHFKGNTQFFNVLAAIQVFLGQSVSFVPRTMANKFIYTTIILVFVLIANDLYSDIIEINFEDKEVNFDSLEDLNKSQMPIFVTSQEYKELFLFNLDDHLLKSLDNKIKSKFNCIQELLSTKSHICLDWEHEVKKFLANKFGSDTRGVSKKLFNTMQYQCDPMFAQFEPGSPFMKRFEKINRRIRESGIMRMVNILHGFVDKIDKIEPSQENGERNLSKQQILFILLIGYSISVLVFIVEYFMIKVKNIPTINSTIFTRLYRQIYYKIVKFLVVMKKKLI